MSTVEEAASLFGSAESDSDIFGSALGSEGHNNGRHNISAPTTNDAVHANPDVDSLFGAAPDSFLENTSWSSSDPHQNYDYNNPDYPNFTSPGDSNQQRGSGWHDQNQQWNTYEQSGTRGTYHNDQRYSTSLDTYQSYKPLAQGSSYSSHNYAPSSQSQYAYSSPVQQTSNATSLPPLWNGAASPYDPYKPNPPLSNSYAPTSTPASSSQGSHVVGPAYDPHQPKLVSANNYDKPVLYTTPASSYDPYKPAGHSHPVPPSRSIYSEPTGDNSQIASAYQPSSKVGVSPTPSAVTAEAYRPKALNAYDPPLPPLKPKRSQLSRHPIQPSSALHNQSIYSSYDVSRSPRVNATPLAPPPPRSGSDRSASVDMPPPLSPPSRKATNAPATSLQNGGNHSGYSKMNGDHYHPPTTDDGGGEQEYVTKSSPQISHFESPSNTNNRPHQSFGYETSPEYIEDPEGGSMDTFAAAEGLMSEASLNEAFDASSVSETSTITPNGKSSGERYIAPPAIESSGLDQPHQYESISSVPLVPQGNSYGPYQPRATVSSPPRKDIQPLHNYQTSPPRSVVRTSSPASIRSQASQYERRQSVYNPYAPGNVNPVAHDPFAPNRIRSASNGSILSMNSNTVDSYAPPSHLRRQSNESSDFGSYTSRPERPLSTASAGFSSQHILATPAYPAYAPSPSLLGTNDPLGRTAARIPVFNFGFGGRVVTCFHGASVLNTGFDVALSSRQSRDIHIHLLHKIIPSSAMEDSTASYPGPLFSDPGSPTVGLVRSGVSAQTKSKKARVIKYLEERIEELSRGIGYLSSGWLEHGRAEGKLILVKLLRIMVENDGRLSGTAELDASIRAALIPRLENSAAVGIERFSTPADGLGGALVSNESPLAVNHLMPSHLEKIQNLLLHGERRQAYHYALDEKLWAHAMVIASSINKEAWQEVAEEFIRTELGTSEAKGDHRHIPDQERRSSATSIKSNGREGLRVAYSLYAGKGASAVQALLPAKPLVKMGESLQLLSPALTNFVTPMSPNFPGPAVAANIPPEILTKWTETVTMMISSPMSLDTSSALTALGDYLISNQWIEAAHACYLLSPQTSPLGGVGSPSTRVVLFGSPSPHVAPAFNKDSDSIILSEIAEFALSLATASKGQEHFAGLQYLQPYRLIRAHSLAEMGYSQLAARYCEAIAASLSRGSPYFTQTFVEQLNGLSNRLIAAPSLDNNATWMSAKMTRPSLDKIGGWLEGRLTKFIAGEGDSSPHPEDTQALQQPHGPFSHYSSISSTTDPSPYSSSANLVSMSGSQPHPARTGSGMALRSSSGSPHLHLNRSSSANDHVRPLDRRSPVNRLGSLTSMSTMSFGQQKPSYGHFNGYEPFQETSSGLTTVENSPTKHNDAISQDGFPGKQASPWWDSAYSDGLDSQTPTSSTFTRVPENGAQSTEQSEFMSPMDNSPMIGVSPLHTPAVNPASVREEDEDEDDLGLGNNSNRSKQATPSNEGNGSASEKPEISQPVNKDAARSEPKTEATSSWLSKWWKKDTTPKPIKANLGEETAFYYDTELKRWVNKKAGAEPPKPTTPLPPPNRSQTASPGRSGSHTSLRPPSGPPPPARPSSAAAVDLTSPPRKPITRVRSNLVPDDATSSLSPPPPGRPRSQASKRPMRSRYVDVFQNPTPPPTGS